MRILGVISSLLVLAQVGLLLYVSIFSQLSSFWFVLTQLTHFVILLLFRVEATIASSI